VRLPGDDLRSVTTEWSSFGSGRRDEAEGMRLATHLHGCPHALLHLPLQLLAQAGPQLLHTGRKQAQGAHSGFGTQHRNIAAHREDWPW